MSDAVQEELPEGFHLWGQEPKVIMDSSGQRVLLASIPITKNGPLNSTSFYTADYHSYFTPEIRKSIGSKEVKERTCCFCLTAVSITTNAVTMRNHFQSDAYWQTHMLHVDLRSWPARLVEEVGNKWRAAAAGGSSAMKRKTDSAVGVVGPMDHLMGTKKINMHAVRKIVTEAIVTGGVIVTMMDNPGLRYLVQHLAFGGDTLPRGLSSRSIQRSIFEMHTEGWGQTKKELMEILLAQPGMKSREEIQKYHDDFGDDVSDMDDPMVNTRRLCLIQDTWSGRNKLGFLGVLAQLMDCRTKGKWSLRNCPLSCGLFRSPHTIERCRDEILSALKSAELSWFYVRSCTQDTTAASIGVCKMVPHVGRIPCFAHTAQLMLKHAAENSPSMADLLNACNHISIAMNRPKRLQMLHDQQKLDNAKLRNTVSLADTRWNSVQVQITALISVMPSLSTVVLTKLDAIFSDDDDKKSDFAKAWNKLSVEGGMEALTKLVVFLELAASWTHALCSKTLVTASLVIPATLSLQAGIQQLLDDSAALASVAVEKNRQASNPNVNEATKADLRKQAQRATTAADALRQYGDAALEQWERYFGKHYTNQWYWLVPALFDPRVFRNSMTQEQMANAILAAKGWVALNTEIELARDDAAAQDEDEDAGVVERDQFAEFVQAGGASGGAPAAQDEDLPPFDMEMKSYMKLLSSKSPDAVASIDPLEFWATIQNLPSLQRIASNVLAIPATSGMAEQLFSTAGWLLSPRRCRLSPDMLNKLVFLYYYKRAEMARIGTLRDKREEKRRKVGATLAKVQLSKIRTKTMLLPGKIAEEVDEDEDEDDEGYRPLADEAVYEAEYDEAEERDEYYRQQQVDKERQLHDAHILNAERIEKEVNELRAWLSHADLPQVQAKFDTLSLEKDDASVSRAFELRTLIAATKARLTELSGKRARGGRR